ncbi:ABC transporter permease, partial [Streptomyces fuscigenes]|nr:ABC transporter permease [Streptomyces fuscigenes]
MAHDGGGAGRAEARTGHGADTARTKARTGHGANTAGARRPRRSSVPAAAPWVRTRLRAAPGLPLGIAVLVLLTAFLAAAFPRALATYEGAALRHALDIASPDKTNLSLSVPTVDTGDGQPAGDAALRPPYLAHRLRTAVGLLPAPLRVRAGQSAYGVRTTKQIPLADTWLAAPGGKPPVATLTTQSGAGTHSRLVAGRLPRASAGSVTSATRTVEGAVTEATATTLHIKVGSVVHVPSGVRAGAVLAVRVTGVLRPDHPSLPYWATEPDLVTPELFRDDPLSPVYWHAVVLLPPEAGPAIAGTTPAAEQFWRLSPDPSGLTSADLPKLEEVVGSAEHGPVLTALTTAMSPRLTVETGLDGVLEDVQALFGSVVPVVSVGAFGVGTVAAVVLVMAGGLAAGRRREELALLRARGASVRGIAGRLLAETAVPAVPA